jgi:hypothetical protein
MTRDEKMAELMAWDIITIKNNMEEGDHNFLVSILWGKPAGWTSYAELSDEEIDDLHQDAVLDERIDDEVKALAPKLFNKQ